MGLAHASIALLIYTCSSDWSSHPLGAWMAVMFVYVFTAAYGLSFGPVAWILPSEACPLVIRSRAVALATASNWVNNFIVGLMTPPLLSASPSLTTTLFSVSCFASLLWSRRLVETRGLSLESLIFADGRVH